MERSSRVLWAFVGIFAMGVASGTLLGLNVARKVAERRIRNGEVVTAPASNAQVAPQQFGALLMRRIVEQLDLTPAQKKQLKPIEQHTNEEMRRLRRDSQHNTEVVIDHMHDEIAPVLTPEQRTKFDDLIARRRDRIKKFFQDQEVRNRSNVGTRRNSVAGDDDSK